MSDEHLFGDPRPSPQFVTAEEHRLWRVRVEALEKGQEALLNRVTRIEKLLMDGQVETQRQYKALREENKALLDLQKETLSKMASIANNFSTQPTLTKIASLPHTTEPNK